jgi:hypothetical protein
VYPGDSASVVGTQLQNLIADFGSFAGCCQPTAR